MLVKNQIIAEAEALCVCVEWVFTGCLLGSVCLKLIISEIWLKDSWREKTLLPLCLWLSVNCAIYSGPDLWLYYFHVWWRGKFQHSMCIQNFPPIHIQQLYNCELLWGTITGFPGWLTASQEHHVLEYFLSPDSCHNVAYMFLHDSKYIKMVDRGIYLHM